MQLPGESSGGRFRRSTASRTRTWPKCTSITRCPAGGRHRFDQRQADSRRRHNADQLDRAKVVTSGPASASSAARRKRLTPTSCFTSQLTLAVRLSRLPGVAAVHPPLPRPFSLSASPGPWCDCPTLISLRRALVFGGTPKRVSMFQDVSGLLAHNPPGLHYGVAVMARWMVRVCASLWPDSAAQTGCWCGPAAHCVTSHLGVGR